jgi:putative aminopeptidase FrvX
MPSKRKFSRSTSTSDSVSIDWDALATLLHMRSPSTSEVSASNVVGTYLHRHGLTMQQDVFGSMLCYLPSKQSNVPTLLLDAHVDEVGVKIVDVDKDGFLRFQKLGGSDAHCIMGTLVWIHTKTGKHPGVVANKSIHLKTRAERTQMPTVDDMFIDVGARSKHEVDKLGIRRGDVVTDQRESQWLTKTRLVGRALDNHVGCFILSQLALLLHRQRSHQLPFHVYICFSVQEEIGLRGIQILSKKLQPDLSIVIDLNVATDHPDIDLKHNAIMKLGHGPAIRRGHSDHSCLVDHVCEVARQHNLPYQIDPSTAGRNNQDAMYVHGIPGLSLGPVARYLHSSVTMVEKRDIQTSVELLYHWLIDARTAHTVRALHPYLRPWKPPVSVPATRRLLQLGGSTSSQCSRSQRRRSRATAPRKHRCRKTSRVGLLRSD